MTLKELIMKTSFDDILPYLERHETAHRDNLYAFREAYDILKNMKPNRDYHEKATIECHVRPDGSKYVRVLFLDDDVWENELAKQLILPDDTPLIPEELAMYCLWEITFYGFSPADRDENFREMFDKKQPANCYEYALDKLRKSIWKRQTPRRLRSKGENGERYVTLQSFSQLLHKKMNGPKRKRKHRQEKRIKHLKTLAKRESLIRKLTIPGSTFMRNEIEHLLHFKYGTRYNYSSVTHGKGERLAYITESMTKYQQLDLESYDSALVFIQDSATYPLEQTELSAFQKTIRQRLGNKNLLFGMATINQEEPEVHVLLLLYRR